MQVGRLQRAPQLHTTTREFLLVRQAKGFGMEREEAPRGESVAVGGVQSFAEGSAAVPLQNVTVATALLIVFLTCAVLFLDLPPLHSSDRPVKALLKTSNSVCKHRVNYRARMAATVDDGGGRGRWWGRAA